MERLHSVGELSLQVRKATLLLLMADSKAGMENLLKHPAMRIRVGRAIWVEEAGSCAQVPMDGTDVWKEATDHLHLQFHPG